MEPGTARSRPQVSHQPARGRQDALASDRVSRCASGWLAVYRRTTGAPRSETRAQPGSDPWDAEDGGDRVLASDGAHLGWPDHVRYEQHDDHPDVVGRPPARRTPEAAPCGSLQRDRGSEAEGANGRDAPRPQRSRPRAAGLSALPCAPCTPRRSSPSEILLLARGEDLLTDEFSQRDFLLSRSGEQASGTGRELRRTPGRAPLETI